MWVGGRGRMPPLEFVKKGKRRDCLLEIEIEIRSLRHVHVCPYGGFSWSWNLDGVTHCHRFIPIMLLRLNSRVDLKSPM